MHNIWKFQFFLWNWLQDGHLMNFFLHERTRLTLIDTGPGGQWSTLGTTHCRCPQLMFVKFACLHRDVDVNDAFSNCVKMQNLDIFNGFVQSQNENGRNAFLKLEFLLPVRCPLPKRCFSLTTERARGKSLTGGDGLVVDANDRSMSDSNKHASFCTSKKPGVKTEWKIPLQ